VVKGPRVTDDPFKLSEGVEMPDLSPQESERNAAQLAINHRISVFFLGLIGVLSAVAAITAVAMPHHMASRPVAAAPIVPTKTVTVAMHDPGCHWFQVGSDYRKTLSTTGPVNLMNTDEAALKISGSGAIRTAAVGQSVALPQGSYRITMVGQASDDNHLSLQVN
jgi:hypothetical protein